MPTLNGAPPTVDHGATAGCQPSSPGYHNKHLCARLHTPSARTIPDPLMQFGLQVVKPHERARVWEEERHRYLPAWMLRPIYRLVIAPIRKLSERGRRPATQPQRH